MTNDPQPIQDEALATAPAYTTVQPPGGPYKAGSIKEGFICSGIWLVLSASLVVGLRLWQEHTHPERGLLESEEWAHFIGGMVGQFLLMALVLSSVVYYRRRRNNTSFILLDWRWWVVCVIFSGFPTKPVLAWLWVGMIYQARLSMKPKFPKSPPSPVSGA
jgi:hypothetical protein